jgi:hypothetical protein
MKRHHMIALAALLSIPEAGAVDPAPIDSIATCDLPHAVMQVSMRNIETQGALAQAKKEQLNEINRLASKAVKPDVAVGDQLSRDDVVLFEKARERLISTGMRGLIESRRERDANVLLQLVQVSDKNYRYQDEVPKGRSDYVYQEILRLFRTIEKDHPRKQEVSSPAGEGCSLDRALYSVEEQGLAVVNSMDLRPASDTLHQLQQRYKTEQIERSELSDADRATYDKVLQTLIYPYQRALQFVGDLEDIRILARASQLIYENDKRDLDLSGGDASKVGATTADFVSKAHPDELTILALALLRDKIDKDLPSQAAIDLKMQAKVAEEANKKYPARREPPK